MPQGSDKPKAISIGDALLVAFNQACPDTMVAAASGSSGPTTECAIPRWATRRRMWHT